jgi:hypothetical protein
MVCDVNSRTDCLNIFEQVLTQTVADQEIAMDNLWVFSLAVSLETTTSRSILLKSAEKMPQFILLPEYLEQFSQSI